MKNKNNVNTILGSIKSHIVCMNAFCYNGIVRWRALTILIEWANGERKKK